MTTTTLIIVFVVALAILLLAWAFRRPAAGAGPTYEVKRDRVFLLGPANASQADVFRAAAKLIDRGFHVIAYDYRAANGLPVAARVDLLEMLQADAVAVMPLWNYWSHPRLIVAAAHAAGKQIVHADTLVPLSAHSRAQRVREQSGECECDADAVLERVGELYGRDAKQELIRRKLENPLPNG